MSGSGNVGNGVKVFKIMEDDLEFNFVYDLIDFDVNVEGYV